MDDNNFNIYSLKMILKTYDFKVDEAESGSKCLEKIKERMASNSCCKHFSIIFMDIDMPGKNGFETAMELFQSIGVDEVRNKVCFCTAFDSGDEREKAIELGIHNFISKPVKRKDLEVVIRTIFFWFLARKLTNNWQLNE